MVEDDSVEGCSTTNVAVINIVIVSFKMLNKRLMYSLKGSECRLPNNIFNSSKPHFEICKFVKIQHSSFKAPTKSKMKLQPTLNSVFGTIKCCKVNRTLTLQDSIYGTR